METNYADFGAIQWSRLLKRLTACAAKWFLQEGCIGEESVLPATGKSAKELAFDTVSEFINGRIEWRPKSSESADVELYLLLRKVMRHDFLDLVKSGRAYRRTDVLDPSTGGRIRLGTRMDRRLSNCRTLQMMVFIASMPPLLHGGYFHS